MPRLSQITRDNLIPIIADDMKYMLINSYTLIEEFEPALYSTCIVRVPLNEAHNIAIYPFPSNGKMDLNSLEVLMDTGKLENQEMRKSMNKAKGKRDNKKDAFEKRCFRKFGYQLTQIYNAHPMDGKSPNKRASKIYQLREERVKQFTRTGIRGMDDDENPDPVQALGHLLSDVKKDSDEFLSHNILFIAKAYKNPFCLLDTFLAHEYSSRPDVFLAHSLIKVKEYMETNSDIISTKALLELLERKGLPECILWLLAGSLQKSLPK